MKYIEMSDIRFVVNDTMKYDVYPDDGIERECFLVSYDIMDSFRLMFFKQQSYWYSTGIPGNGCFVLYLLYSIPDQKYFYLLLGKFYKLSSNVNVNFLLAARDCFGLKHTFNIKSNKYYSFDLRCTWKDIPPNVYSSMSYQDGIRHSDFIMSESVKAEDLKTIEKYIHTADSNFTGPSICSCGFVNEYVSDPNYECQQCKLFKHMAS